MVRAFDPGGAARAAPPFYLTLIPCSLSVSSHPNSTCEILLRTLSVLRSVEEQKGSLPAEPPTYQVMLERWNRKHPGESYPDYRAFRKAYKRAFENVVYPSYNDSSRRKPTPNMELQKRRHQREMEQARMRAERIGQNKKRKLRVRQKATTIVLNLPLRLAY